MKSVFGLLLMCSMLFASIVYADNDGDLTPGFLNSVINAIRNGDPEQASLLADLESAGRAWNAVPGELSELMRKLSAAPFDRFVGTDEILQNINFATDSERREFMRTVRDIVAAHVLLDRETRTPVRSPYSRPDQNTVSVIIIRGDKRSISQAERRFGRKLNIADNVGHEAQHALDTHEPRLIDLWHSSTAGIFGVGHASNDSFETRFRGNFGPGLVVFHKELRGYRAGFQLTQQNASLPVMLYGALFSTASNIPSFTDSDHARPLIYAVLQATAISLGKSSWEDLTIDEAVDGFESVDLESVLQTYEAVLGGSLVGNDIKLFQSIKSAGELFFCVKSLKSVGKQAPKNRYKRRK